MKYKLINQHGLKFSYPCFLSNLSRRDNYYIFALTLASQDFEPMNLITCRVILKLWNRSPCKNTDKLSIQRY